MFSIVWHLKHRIVSVGGGLNHPPPSTGDSAQQWFLFWEITILSTEHSTKLSTEGGLRRNLGVKLLKSAFKSVCPASNHAHTQPLSSYFLNQHSHCSSGTKFKVNPAVFAVQTWRPQFWLQKYVIKWRICQCRAWIRVHAVDVVAFWSRLPHVRHTCVFLDENRLGGVRELGFLLVLFSKDGFCFSLQSSTKTRWRAFRLAS